MGFYIGNVYIGDKDRDECPLILGPMAGVCDMPYRILCAENGADLVYTEMVSAKALYYGDKKTEQLMNVQGEKRPIAIQIFGSEPDVMGQVAKQVSKRCDILDINMGCPAPKVVKNGDGSRVLLDLDLVKRITEEVVKSSNKPVTVKIRKGWDANHVVAVEAAKIIEAAGADAIVIHGRTRD